MASRKYDEDSIQRFAGLAGIRKKATVYIGPNDSDGLWTIFREPADNAVDQALAGRNKMVHLLFDSEPNVFWVADAGEGIPVGNRMFEDERGRKEKMSTLYVVTGLTHGGSNFTGDTISRGTHGIGIKATNAMSKRFTVWTYREGQWYCIEYRNAKLHKDVYKCKAPKLPHGVKTPKGTVVRFEPDLSLFTKNSAMAGVHAQEWASLTSYLVKGLAVRLTYPSGKTREYKTGGPAEYIVDRLAPKEGKPTITQMGKSFVFSSKEIDVAVAFTDTEGDNIDAYTNGLRNREGGEHVKALVEALVRSLKPYLGKNKFTSSDVRDGLLGLVNYKIAAPKFNNQPKDRLVDDRVYPIALPQLTDAWSEFWKRNKSMAKDVVQRASLLRSKTNDFLKDKKMVKNVNAAKKKIQSKLADVVGSAPVDERELFIVEGDSAGGGAVRARDRSFQAIYPLRGKPLNVMEASKDKIHNNKEIIGLLAALGIDVGGKKNNEIKISYGKIILLADADVDGSHINVLICGAIYKFAPSVIDNGQLYAVKSPLYKGRHKNVVYFGMTREEVWKQAGAKCDVTYLKGWGELSPEDLGVALDPAKRTLYRIVASNKQGNTEFEMLLGKNVDYRKKLFGVD